jgi:hypothetical protein
MKTIHISMPTAGVVNISVEVPDDFGEDEENIEALFHDNWEELDAVGCADHTWDFFNPIVQGNVLHTYDNEMDWTVERDEED